MPSDRQRQSVQPNRTRSQTQHTKPQPQTAITNRLGRWFRPTGLGHLLVGIWAISGAIATAFDGSLVQLMERQAQTIFFQVRGSVQPPNNIVILAIDEDSLAQGRLYQSDPENLAYLEPIQKWAWKREAYAIAIDKLMKAGAKSVGVDILLDLPSSYQHEDDEKLRQVLQKYPGQVILAASYEDAPTRSGILTQLIQPYSFFQINPESVGSINFLLEPDGRIHRFASEFPKLLAQQQLDPTLAQEFIRLIATVPSFDEAVLKASGLSYPKPKGNNIFFYGPSGTFESIPFWYVLDPDNWNTYLKKGEYFKNKIVLIGGTATLFQDAHATPFSNTLLYPEEMSGLEVHANAIATLLAGRSITQAIPNLTQRGLFVLITVVGAGFVITRIKHLPIRLGLAAGTILLWGGMSYGLFVYGRVIIPTTVPITAIALSTLSYGTIGSIRDYFIKRRLRQTFKHYSSSPIVQEIISQQDEFHEILDERELELLETKLGGRYKIIKRLSAGGFGETYIAEDTQRPGNPHCVVKQLRPASNDPKLWELARRLFIKEAEILEKLGKHDHIPQLLAHFEEADEFYLVEEFIQGRPLTQEIPLMVPMEEARVVAILRDVLYILEFVHAHGVIHRDIKPDNIIRRQSDGKLVLIDFGAVKELSTQWMEGNQRTELTIGIGTKGYAPNEQAAGNPKYSSDIYALAAIAIQALTVIHPGHLPSDPATGEIIWEDKAQVSAELAAIIKKMVRYNFRDRYQSATEVLEALQPLIAALPPELASNSGVMNKPSIQPTKPNLNQLRQEGSETATLKDVQEATKLSSESSYGQEEEEASTRIWTDSSSSEEEEASTRIWTDSSSSEEEEESTRIWTDSSSSEDENDSTIL